MAPLGAGVTPRLIQLAGPSESGKTLLAERLVQILPGPVAYLKWTHHALPAERPLSDTARTGQASLLAGPDGAVIRAVRQRPILYRTAVTLFADYAWLIIEGDKTGPLPKILLGANDPSLVGSLWVMPHPPAWVPKDAAYRETIPLTPTSASRLADYIASRADRLSVPAFAAFALFTGES
ncbi:MAG: molybdopterin-guanine dinucleotide biosynthesis protein MobB [Thermaerobacter sp.]|nr:molybdopterin-guanine dinucleotide biosynthesis protein MobB [Thermaerobacter sp.]